MYLSHLIGLVVAGVHPLASVLALNLEGPGSTVPLCPGAGPCSKCSLMQRLMASQGGSEDQFEQEQLQASPKCAQSFALWLTAVS